MKPLRQTLHILGWIIVLYNLFAFFWYAFTDDSGRIVIHGLLMYAILMIIVDDMEEYREELSKEQQGLRDKQARVERWVFSMNDEQFNQVIADLNSKDSVEGYSSVNLLNSIREKHRINTTLQNKETL